MENLGIVIAGFGGQGVLFTGKVIAYSGLIKDKEVSWLPSYGPEMRGGTANCSVCISDKPIGSPLVPTPDMLIVMNKPSYDKFIDSVKPGGIVVYDETLIEADNMPEGISYFPVSATEISRNEDLSGLSNIILLGKAIKESAFTDLETAEAALAKCISERKNYLLDSNIKALNLGINL